MLNVNEMAPDFEANDQNGEVVKLSELRGERVILYFYPKDNTPGCTAEACSLRDGYEQLRKEGFVVLGVSPDSDASHRKFIEKHTLPFNLLIDTDHSISQAYGVWGEKKFMGRVFMGMIRTTFLIDKEGRIEKIFTKVNTKDHAQQIIDSL